MLGPSILNTGKSVAPHAHQARCGIAHEEPSPMLIKRSMLFFCIALSGVLLDARWTWYSYHFAAVCSDSGNIVPATWFLFSGVSLIPAVASLVFRSDPVYIILCLIMIALYTAFQIYLITDAKRFEELAGVNCYRDVGSGAAVSLAFTVFFSAIIVAITLTFGAIRLVRKWLIKDRSKACAVA
jgi:uncharacterized membrane protein SirB2